MVSHAQEATQPLVTYAIPAFNHADYVQDAIRSIISQTYQNIELIVIDDGSSDGSFRRIQALEKECKRRFSRYTLVSRSNQGLAPTLNEMLTWSQGKYFACLASDDLVTPDKLSDQVPYLERHDDCVAVFSNANIIDASGAVVTRVSRAPRDYTFDDIFFHWHSMPALTQLVRRDAIVAIGGFDVQHGIEDWSMWLALTENGCRCHRLGLVHGLYRRHSENMSQNYQFMHRERLNIVSRYRDVRGYNRAVAECHRRSGDELLCQDRLSALRLYLAAARIDPRITTSLHFWGSVAKSVRPKWAANH